ncbi:resolvase domain-containing protein [Oceanibaculum indicum P24]|uniref:Resolvase domain-containing protein n=1 Tax=Oceanibaculum indicum P24 TaxID=1207063 RepID=K2JC83_9PROT|nr:resolvase domain-containing protein [Oceanibaculum indicum P24]
MSQRAALYLRVSTARQAERGLSIPDQQAQCEGYCQRQGWEVADIYIDPGHSGTDPNRPALQDMLAKALSPERPYDVIVVHSWSRLYRDHAFMELTIRKLAKRHIGITTITGTVSDDPNAHMTRQIVGVIDEHFSRMNAVHTLRGMRENAKQGFWNGSVPPLGYRTYIAEQRGDKLKKKLDVAPDEAQLVKLIYRLYLEGDGPSGPMGVKAIACYLNERGYRQRGGGKFTTKTTHEILTRPAYKGEHVFNMRSAKTGEIKPESEHIRLPVPAIIDEATFAAVQDRLRANNPKVTPPRVVNGPSLLTGLATCSNCGGGMTMNTGKGGRYRYYACATAMRMGKTACTGRRVRMDHLDRTVTAALLDKVLAPERVTVLLGGLIERAANKQQTRTRELADLRKELREVEAKKKRLIGLVAEGVLDAGDADLREQMRAINTRQDDLIRMTSVLQREQDKPLTALTAENVTLFADALRERLQSGDVQFRKAYLRHFIDSIVVDESEVTIRGSKEALAQAVREGTETGPKPVLSFARKWRPHGDSNPGCRRERAVS